MNTIKLTRQNLHALSGSPGKCGFTRKQVEMLGFAWPPTKGWLTSLIGKTISLELYESVRNACRKKWQAHQDMERATLLANASRMGAAVDTIPTTQLPTEDVRALVKVGWEMANWISENDKSATGSIYGIEYAHRAIAKVASALPPF